MQRIATLGVSMVSLSSSCQCCPLIFESLMQGQVLQVAAAQPAQAQQQATNKDVDAAQSPYIQGKPASVCRSRYSHSTPTRSASCHCV